MYCIWRWMLAGALAGMGRPFGAVAAGGPGAVAVVSVGAVGAGPELLHPEPTSPITPQRRTPRRVFFMVIIVLTRG